MCSTAVGNSRIGRAHQILIFSLHYGILYLSWETAMRCACNNYVAETNALPASSRELREIQIFFLQLVVHRCTLVGKSKRVCS